jgi:hypothetical protein
MKVNFDNLRRQTIYSYNRLVCDLQDNKETQLVIIDIDHLEGRLNDLRNNLVFLAALEDDKNGEFECLKSEDMPLVF